MYPFIVENVLIELQENNSNYSNRLFKNYILKINSEYFQALKRRLFLQVYNIRMYIHFFLLPCSQFTKYKKKNRKKQLFSQVKINMVNVMPL